MVDAKYTFIASNWMLKQENPTSIFVAWCRWLKKINYAKVLMSLDACKFLVIKTHRILVKIKIEDSNSWKSIIFTI